MIRVLLVDDDPLLRAGLAMMLGGAEDIEVVGQAADGDEVPAAVAGHRPDVVLMDVRMPRTDGVSATARLRAAPQPPEVIVLTTFDADDLVLAAIRSGASGFLVKDTPPADIARAIRAVAAGEAMLSPAVTRKLLGMVAVSTADDARQAALTRLQVLSDREREVAIAVGQGLSNAEIAQRLYVSVATVKATVTRLLIKLEAGNRVQVALLAHDAGLA